MRSKSIMSVAPHDERMAARCVCPNPFGSRKDGIETNAPDLRMRRQTDRDSLPLITSVLLRSTGWRIRCRSHTIDGKPFPGPMNYDVFISYTRCDAAWAE